MTEISGHDGPYPGPVEVRGNRVQSEWIDYNGHMNVGYYGVAFDLALEVMLDDHLGLGETYVRHAGFGPYIVQSHLHFLRELLEDQPYLVRYRLIDHDRKRLHYYAEMWSETEAVQCATQEALIVNVSQETGRAAEFPDWAVSRLARMASDHAGLPRPEHLNAAIGIRRK